MQYYCPTQASAEKNAGGDPTSTIDKLKTILSAKDVGPLPVAYLQALQDNFSVGLAEEFQDPPLDLTPFTSLMPHMSIIMPTFGCQSESQPIGFYQCVIRSLSSFLDKAKGTSQASTK